MIHVVLISEWPPERGAAEGGVQVSSERLARALVRAGARVSVVVPAVEREAGPRSSADGGLDVYRVPADDRWSLLRLLRPWRRRAQEQIGALGGEIVHGQGLIAGGLAAADCRDMPRVVTAHGNAAADTRSAYRGLGAASRAALRDHLARSVARRVDAVVGVHPDRRLNVPCEPRRFVHIPNVVDDRYFSLERRTAPGLVVFAGGPRAIKGWDVLASAWPAVRRRVAGATLAVAGWPSSVGDPDVGDAERASVRTHRSLSPVAMADLLGRAAVVVIPSRFEVAPLLLAEAWAAGVPVVATSVGGIPSLAGGAAVLVEPGSSSALADGLVQALEQGDELQGLVAEGRRRAEGCRAEAVARAHLELYQELLETSP